MKASLSVLLPVHNAQSTVGDAIGRLLEVLPELTNRFEIIVVDDGSTDATCEVADDWARHYPQVSFFRQAASGGWQVAIAKHAWRARGEYLMLLVGEEVDAVAISGAWSLRDEMPAAGSDRAAAEGRTLRIDRGQDGLAAKSPEAAVGASTLARIGIHLPARTGHVLLVHRFRLAELERALAAASGSPDEPRERPAEKSRIKGPNFLSRIKQFALGE